MKKYLIKVYDQQDVYLTTWTDNVSNIEFNNEINSAGGQLSITLARNAGDYGEGSDVDFNHKVKIYCYDIDYPSGLVVFQGYISAYTPIYKDNNVEVTVLGFGSEFEKYMLQNTFNIDNSKILEAGTITGIKAPTYSPITYFGGDKNGAGDWFTTGVKFTAPASMNGIYQIDATFHSQTTETTPLDTALPSNCTLTVYPILSTGARTGYPDFNNPLGSKTILEGTLPTRVLGYTALNYDGRYADPLVYSFLFDEVIPVVGGTNYVFMLEAPEAPTYVDGVSGLVSGSMWAEWFFEVVEASATGYDWSARTRTYAVVVGGENPWSQSFVPTQSVYLSRVELKIGKTNSPSGNVYVKIYAHSGSYGSSSLPTGSPLATSTAINASTFSSTTTVTSFYFTGANQILLNAGTAYVFVLESAAGDASNYVKVEGDYITHSYGGNAGVYAGSSWSALSTIDLCFYIYGNYTNDTSRNYYYYERSGVGGESYSSTKVMPFSVYASDGSTTVQYNSKDPSNILKDIVDKYRFLGGTINYSIDSIDLTGTSVSYTFNTNTILEAVSKIVELCPENWYWYMDQATNTIHLHEKSDAPDHTFSLEKDIIDARFEKRIEDLVNTIYFTGGGDPPLYRKYSNKESVLRYGIKSLKYSDQRVTVINTAEIIANSILSTKSEPELRVTIELLDSNNGYGVGYDIESINVGDLVAVRNITQQVGLSTWDVGRWDSEYWDFNVYNLSSLQMQIQKLEYKEDKAIIQASTMAVDVNKRIEDINRNLETLQTLNNPTTPT